MREGGWLYKCGHFSPSTFLQVAKVNSDCYNCKFAKEVLEQAKHLRRRKVSQESKWVLKGNSTTAPVKRTPDCVMDY